MHSNHKSIVNRVFPVLLIMIAAMAPVFADDAAPVETAEIPAAEVSAPADMVEVDKDYVSDISSLPGIGTFQAVYEDGTYVLVTTSAISDSIALAADIEFTDADGNVYTDKGTLAFFPPVEVQKTENAYVVLPVWNLVTENGSFDGVIGFDLPSEYTSDDEDVIRYAENGATFATFNPADYNAAIIDDVPASALAGDTFTVVDFDAEMTEAYLTHVASTIAAVLATN